MDESLSQQQDQAAVAPGDAQSSYEPPVLTDLGSLADLTLGVTHLGSAMDALGVSAL